MKRSLERDEEEALTELIKRLDEDERTPGSKTGLGETLRELFYSSRGGRLCITRASEGFGLLDSPERDCGTP